MSVRTRPLDAGLGTSVAGEIAVVRRAREGG